MTILDSLRPIPGLRVLVTAGGGGIDEALHHVQLVVHGQLHRHERPRGGRGRRGQGRGPPRQPGKLPLREAKAKHKH